MRLPDTDSAAVCGGPPGDLLPEDSLLRGPGVRCAGGATAGLRRGGRLHELPGCHELRFGRHRAK